MRKLFLAIFLVLFMASPVWAAAYYVDLDAASNGDGSYGSPWNSVDNITGLSDGDDVFLKCDTTESNDLRTSVRGIDGTNTNQACLGAYYLDGGSPVTSVNAGNDCDANGSFSFATCSARPILDGNTYTIPSDSYAGLLEIDTDYVTVDHIKTYKSGGIGIKVDGDVGDGADSVEIKNCIAEYNWRQGICWAGGSGESLSDGLVEDSMATWSGMNCGGVGGLLDGSDWDVPGIAGGTDRTCGICSINANADNLTIRRCTSYYSAGEGMGFYRYTTGGIAEYNVAYDNRQVQFYVAGSASNTVRYNLIYCSNDDGKRRSSTDQHGLAVNRETQGVTPNDNIILGNIIIGCRGSGLRHTNATASDPVTGNKFYDNTMIDNYVGFTPGGASSLAFEYKNNIVWTITDGYSDFSTYGAGGYTATCSSNSWTSTPVAGMATDDVADVIGAPGIAVTSGYQDLTAGAVDGTEVYPVGGAAVIDTGTNLTSTYDDIIATCDFTASPISVTTGDQDSYGSGWEIGAFVYTGATYYADDAGSGTTCSDVSPCSLEYAIETKAGDGDTIIVQDGTYTGVATYTISDANLTIQAENGPTGTLTSRTWTAIIDGGDNQGSCASNNYTALVRVEVSGVTIDGLEIKNSSGRLVSVPQGSDDNFTLKNSNLKQSCNQLLYLFNSDNPQIYQNYFSEAPERAISGSLPLPASITFVGPGAGGSFYKNVVFNDHWYGMDSFHQSSPYTGPIGLVVEKNMFIGGEGQAIYMNCAKDQIVRYNLIIGTNDACDHSGFSGSKSYEKMKGIEVRNENLCSSGYGSGHQIYGNLIANVNIGLLLAVQTNDTDTEPSNVSFYNNTVIAPNTYGFQNSNADQGTGNSFTQNIISTYSASGANVGTVDDTDITVGYNHFSDAQAAIDDDLEGTGDTYSTAAPISKTTDWNGANLSTLIANWDCDGSWFSLTSDLTGNTEKTVLDPDTSFLAAPISVITMAADNIGAYGYEVSPPGAGGDTGLYNVLGGTKQRTLGGSDHHTLSGE